MPKIYYLNIFILSKKTSYINTATLASFERISTPIAKLIHSWQACLCPNQELGLPDSAVRLLVINTQENWAIAQLILEAVEKTL